MILEELPSHLPEYCAVFPRLANDFAERNFDPKKYENYHQLRRISLRASNINFKLPSRILEIKWTESDIVQFTHDHFVSLRRLSTLNISFNQLRKLPELPPQLKLLDISFNKIDNLTFQKPLKHLQSLKASNNLLDSVPENIVEFSNLQNLQLNDNKLCSLPNLDNLELESLDIRNNRLARLPRVWEGITDFLIDGNFSTIPGPYLGTEFLLRDHKFNAERERPPVKHNLPTSSVQPPPIAKRPDKIPPKPRPLSKQSSKSSISSNGSSISSLSEETKKLQIQKTETARKTALQNYRRIQSEKENGSRFDQHVSSLNRLIVTDSNRKPTSVRAQNRTKPLYSNSCNKNSRTEHQLLEALSECLRKQLPPSTPLMDGIIFIRAYNARRKKTSEALLVELPGPNDDTLSSQKASRNAERFANTARESGFHLTARDVLELRTDRILPYLAHLCDASKRSAASSSTNSIRPPTVV
ncbi:Oidioi.mRNA.OKI2018_I69.PAR.g12715.t1.cds [Oikopleura dioica]|uniref:Oidioi.mRNA.OKI2018_I69.PAR.g12715.t1.cds n=1 Tax=Oikopleura dioica TaxID=34765 RepID=A0ABN7S913_OIKDI|nr:Oidioi.mRNA.OKI2018_I69.PAR.g12715.t1.cds [Oikopleura dioica]